MLKNKSKILFYGLISAFILLLPLIGFGADGRSLVPCSFIDCTICHLLKTAEGIISWLLTLSFAVAVLFAVISGYFYLFSVGKRWSIKKAKKWLNYVLAGFAICLLAWLVVHTLYAVLGYKGSWWQMECVVETAISDMPSASELYINEVTANNIGGRKNPLTLPDLATAGIKNLPANKYFFLHGLGGQPLANAAKQLAQITEAADKEGKIVYVITPVKNQKSLEIEGSQPINLTSLIGPNLIQTERNIKSVLIGLIADSPTGTNFPFFIADSEDKLSKFNNVWPGGVTSDKSLKTYHNGVVYQEGEILDEAKEETFFSVNLESDNPKDPKKEKFFLDRDNPITFNLPQDISPTAARQMAIDTAQVVAESTRNSQLMDKDQWVQLLNLMSKDIATGKKSAEDEVYNPAAFASYAQKNPGQATDPQKIKAVEKELDRIAKEIIDKELPRNSLPAGQAGNNNNSSLEKAAPNNTNNVSEEKSLFESIGDYFYEQFSSTPTLDNWIATEKKTPENGGNVGNSINVNRIPNLDPSRLSKIGGRITTDNILSLEQREAIKDLVLDIQKEIKDNISIDHNIPADLIMCVFNKESKFDPGAMSQTGCSGLGQLSMGAARSATKKLKKIAPGHFKALSEKVQKYFDADMEAVMTREGGNDKKREILRSDANLNAVLSYTHLTEKGIVGRGGTARNEQDLRAMVIGYGPGNASYAYSIMGCLNNLSWRVIPDNIQIIIAAREADSKK